MTFTIATNGAIRAIKSGDISRSLSISALNCPGVIFAIKYLFVRNYHYICKTTRHRAAGRVLELGKEAEASLFV